MANFIFIHFLLFTIKYNTSVFTFLFTKRYNSFSCFFLIFLFLLIFLHLQPPSLKTTISILEPRIMVECERFSQTSHHHHHHHHSITPKIPPLYSTLENPTFLTFHPQTTHSLIHPFLIPLTYLPCSPPLDPSSNNQLFFFQSRSPFTTLHHTQKPSPNLIPKQPFLPPPPKTHLQAHPHPPPSPDFDLVHATWPPKPPSYLTLTLTLTLTYLPSGTSSLMTSLRGSSLRRLSSRKQSMVGPDGVLGEFLGVFGDFLWFLVIF